MMEFNRSFRAMNTDVQVVVAAGRTGSGEAESALAGVERLFADAEAVMSRFRPESELSRLNLSSGRPFQASPMLFDAISAALGFAAATGGIFDPTLLDELVAAGYDTSFEKIARGSSAGTRRSAASARRSAPALPRSWMGVVLDRRARTILIPRDRRMDLGGIGKGWTVDRAAELLSRRFSDFVVDAGGDLRASGVQGDGSPWTIGVQDPLRLDADLLVLAVSDAAVATSSVARRRWTRDGRPWHHLIDPRTGLPAESGVLSATVIAESVARAEVLAKAALILGPSAGMAFLDDQPGVEGMLVLAGGGEVRTAGLREVQNVA